MKKHFQILLKNLEKNDGKEGSSEKTQQGGDGEEEDRQEGKSGYGDVFDSKDESEEEL